MIFTFSGFRLDSARRELILRGREVVVQPKVFDLLEYLIEHRDRVSSKNELMDALWPGTLVVEGALQRVVSLARSALHQGGQRQAIRTYSGRGYRFCIDVDAEEGTTTGRQPSNSLDRARRAYRELDWDTAVKAYAEADRDNALPGADLVCAAQATQWCGHPSDAVELLERAIVAHQSQNDRRGAANAAVWLAQIFFERMDTAIAAGWMRRAQRFLPPGDVSREQGLIRCLSSRIALLEGDLQKALTDADRTYEIGAELDDADLEGLGLLYRGHAQLSLGSVDEGLGDQNEAAAAVLSSRVSPWAGALIYCGVIWTCRMRADWERAAQWTGQFTRWCADKQMSYYPGTCRLHRAEVLSVRGDTDEAERELHESRGLLSRCAPWAEGDACRVLGDLRLARGDLAGAEEAYHQARELGWDPQPGYAMLLLERGEQDEAVRRLEAALDNPNWANQEGRGRLLAHLLMAASRASQRERAHQVLAELEAGPWLRDTPAVIGTLERGRAELAYLELRLRDGIRHLRAAIDSWTRVGSPLNVAHLRLRQCRFLLESGDADGAYIELDLAEKTFERQQAKPLLARCRELREAQ